MEEYKAILRLIDRKLDDDERLIEFLRSENIRLENEKTEIVRHVESLEAANKSLTEELKRQDGVISELKEKIESEKKIKKVDV